MAATMWTNFAGSLSSSSAGLITLAIPIRYGCVKSSLLPDVFSLSPTYTHYREPTQANSFPVLYIINHWCFPSIYSSWFDSIRVSTAPLGLRFTVQAYPFFTPSLPKSCFQETTFPGSAISTWTGYQTEAICCTAFGVLCKSSICCGHWHLWSPCDCRPDGHKK